MSMEAAKRSNRLAKKERPPRTCMIEESLKGRKESYSRSTIRATFTARAQPPPFINSVHN